MDAGIIPLVGYFNSVGMKTKMSCQGHDTLSQSLLWVEFASTIGIDNIVEFERAHTDEHGVFWANGRFVIRILAEDPERTTHVDYSYQYVAASLEAALDDLNRWKSIDYRKHQQEQEQLSGVARSEEPDSGEDSLEQ